MRWLSKAAVLWALDEAEKVPAHLVSTLIAVARYAGADGRGAHPSAATIAMHTRKTTRQAQRDLAELEKRGLIRRGDPRLVAHIAASYRPSVYDLGYVTHDVPDTTSMSSSYDIERRPGTSPTSYKEIQKGSRTARGARGRAAPRYPQASDLCGRCGNHPSGETCWA